MLKSKMLVLLCLTVFVGARIFYKGGHTHTLEVPASHAILILCSYRTTHVDFALHTWSQVHDLQFPIFLSVDRLSAMPAMQKLVDKWTHNFTVPITLQQSYQAHVKPDYYLDERVARHWISSITRLFIRRGYDYVWYFEEDHIVAPSIVQSGLQLIRQAHSVCNSCFAFYLGCHRNCYNMTRADTSPMDVMRMGAGNMGVIYILNQWRTLLKRKKEFCKLQGNWDINLNYMMRSRLVQPHGLTLLHRRVEHLTDTESARTGKNYNLGSMKIWQQQYDTLRRIDSAVNGRLIDCGTRVENPKRPPMPPNHIFERCLQSIGIYA